jgi:hypothetical protein
MRITVDQRLSALEREVVVLDDTVKLLHKMLKEQRELINEYITAKVSAAELDSIGKAGEVRPEDALYTFVCKRRFDKLDKELVKARKRIENLHPGLEVG